MLRIPAVDFVYYPVAQTAKGVVHNLYPRMAGIHQPFDMQIVSAAHHNLTTDDLTRRNRCLHLVRSQHQFRNPAVNDPPGQTVNPFPHSTTYIFILMCILFTLM